MGSELGEIILILPFCLKRPSPPISHGWSGTQWDKGRVGLDRPNSSYVFPKVVYFKADYLIVFVNTIYWG
jgi:hypothetical protein